MDIKIKTNKKLEPLFKSFENKVLTITKIYPNGDAVISITGLSTELCLEQHEYTILKGL